MALREIKNSQNFLKNKELIQRILDKTNICLTDLVLEIGPGKGIITQELAKRCRMVIAIEKDQHLFQFLKEKFKGDQKIKIILEDFLNYPLPTSPYKVFSNIPFNLTADIIKKLTSAKNPPNDAYLIIQKEAAKKFVGYPCSQKSQMYALFLKPYFEMRIVWSFKRSDFVPEPKVDAVLVYIEKRENFLIQSNERQLYRDFIAYGFDQWKLNLKKSFQHIFTYQQFRRLSKELKFSLEATPTDLNFSQWLGLFRYFLVGVAKEKQALVGEAQRNLEKRQKNLKKIHRTNLSYARQKSNYYQSFKHIIYFL